MTSSVVGLTRSSKALSKAKLAHTKNVIVTVWWSAAHLIHYGFLSLGETIISETYAQQIDEMHQNPQCLQPALVNRKGPVLLRDSDWPHGAQPTLQKLNNWATTFCLICHIHLISCRLTTLIQASWQLFIGKTLLQLAVSRKCFPRVCWTLKHRLLCYRKKILISCWQKCFDHNGSYFD